MLFFTQIPSSPPTKKELLSTKSSFFVIQAAGFPEASVRALGVPVGLVWNQRAPRVVWNPDEVAHGIARSAYRIKFLRLGCHTRRCRDSIQTFGLIPYRNKLRIPYKAYALIYLRKCDIINSPINKNLCKSKVLLYLTQLNN